jgi:hypothetical protein
MEIEMQIVLLILNSLLGVIITHVFFVCFLGKRVESKGIYYIVTLASFFVANVFISFYAVGTMWIPLFFSVFCFCYSLFLFSGTLPQRCFAAGMFIAYASITETLSVFFVSWIFSYEFVTTIGRIDLFFLTAFIAKLLLFVVVLSVARLRKTEVLKAPIKKLIPLCMVILICTFLSLANSLSAMEGGNPVTTFELSTEITIFILSILVFNIYKSLVTLTEKEVHNELLEKQLEQDSQYFQRMDDYLSEVRSLKHDFTNHLTIIKALAEEEKYIDLDIYINRYLKDTQMVLSEIITGIPSVDAIISTKKSVAIESGIEFFIHTKYICDLKINPVHLSIILANILDNAIEACEKCVSETPKKIELSLMMEREYLYIEIKNSSVPILFKQGTIPQTTKVDKIQHGLGLETIKRLVLRYEGELYCEYETGEFTFWSRIKNFDYSFGAKDGILT